MIIRDIVILDLEKLERKHNVQGYEVEEALWQDARFFYWERANIEDEDVYRALGRTEEGRFLVGFFVYKKDQTALVLSARDDSERKTPLWKKIRRNQHPLSTDYPNLSSIGTSTTQKIFQSCGA